MQKSCDIDNCEYFKSLLASRREISELQKKMSEISFEADELLEREDSTKEAYEAYNSRLEAMQRLYAIGDEMRRLQREYLVCREPERLLAAKAATKKFDEALAECSWLDCSQGSKT